MPAEESKEAIKLETTSDDELNNFFLDPITKWKSDVSYSDNDSTSGFGGML